MRHLAFAAFVMVPLVAFGAFAEAQSGVPRARIIEDLRLDATKEDFSRIDRIHVGPRGQIAVPLRQDYQIRLYDSSGTVIARIGRRGGGPGEFEAVGPIAWVGDTLWVWDPRARRGTFFDANGKLLRTATLPQARLLPTRGGSDSTTLMFPGPVAAYADGSVIAAAYVDRRSRADPAAWSEQVDVRIAPNGDARIIAKPAALQDDRWFMTVEGFGRGVPFALPPQAAISFDGSRLVYLWGEMTSRTGGRYVVSLVGSKGDTMYVRSFSFTGTPIPKSSADSALATFIPKPGTPTEGPANLPQRFQALARERMPSVYFTAESAMPGIDNTVWIGMRPTAEGRITIALNARGEAMASVLTPRESVVRQASATHIWVTETDADGLVSVVRYKVIGIRN